MKTLLVISVLYINYVTAHEKYAVKSFPKKVKPYGAGKILINPAKYMYKPTSPDPLKGLSDMKSHYTVFQVISNSKTNRGVPDSPYFSVDQTIDHKPRVKKVLPNYVWSSLARAKRSIPEAPIAESEAPKAESDASKTESEVRKAESETTKAASEAPKASTEVRKAEKISPKVESETPNADSPLEPKSESKTSTSPTNKSPEKKKVQTTSQKPKIKQDIVLRAHDVVETKVPKKRNLTTTKRVEKLPTKLKAELTAASKTTNETEININNDVLKRDTRAAKKKKPLRKRNDTLVYKSRSSKTNGTKSKKKLRQRSKSKNGTNLKKAKTGRRRRKSKSKKSKKDSLKTSKSKRSSKKGKKRTLRDVNSTDIKILKETRRLTGAKEALIEDYPYVVSIQKDGVHWCSGALLNPRMVITTANCLWKANRISRMEVRCGSSYTDQGGQLAEIAEVMRHPRWGMRNIPDNDVALILLDRTIKFSHSVHAIDLPNRVMWPAFDDAWVTSFGSERRDGIFEEHETNLQAYHTYLMSNETCNNITTRFGVTVTENFICFSQSGRTSPCTRDTGAPAVSDGVLWGLASWSIRKLCGTERFPSMFSYLASHSNMDFITEATRQMMSEKRVYPFLDRSLAPKLRFFQTSPASTLSTG